MNALIDALKFCSVELLLIAHSGWVASATQEEQQREESWSQSVVVGRTEFAQRTQLYFGIQGRNHELSQADGLYVLHEDEAEYETVIGAENRPIASINQHLWDVS